MKKWKLGKRLLRLGVLGLCFIWTAGVLSGCGESKYHQVELTKEAAPQGAGEEAVEEEMMTMAALSVGGHGREAGNAENAGREGLQKGDAQAEDAQGRDVEGNGVQMNDAQTEDSQGEVGQDDTTQGELSQEGHWETVPGEDLEDEAMLSHASVLAAAANQRFGNRDTAEAAFNGFTVAIDAGHQAKANAKKEAIGPSSQTMKAKMPEGGVGVSSGVKEHQLTLAVAKKLQEQLTERGYHVFMIRESSDVNLSSAERSVMANESGADILIRLHANSMDNSGIYGAMAMCMTSQNPYNAYLHEKSYDLSKKIIDNICAHTGTKNRGVQEVDNSGDINWSEIPVSVVEMGFLSHPDEDMWLQSDEYQNKITNGIVSAVDLYFAEGN